MYNTVTTKQYLSPRKDNDSLKDQQTKQAMSATKQANIIVQANVQTYKRLYVNTDI